LSQAGVTALYLDYTETDSIEAAVGSVFEATGGTLDALFNNGAYAQPGALEDVSRPVLRAQFEANFFGWHDLTRRVIPAMRKQGHGRIVMCSSILGFITMGLRGPYSTTKFAL
jgi:NAD(P)-dependent dehydrogenase (short-subunit alcohol dehydrogenase family)